MLSAAAWPLPSTRNLPPVSWGCGATLPPRVLSGLACSGASAVCTEAALAAGLMRPGTRPARPRTPAAPHRPAARQFALGSRPRSRCSPPWQEGALPRAPPRPKSERQIVFHPAASPPPGASPNPLRVYGNRLATPCAAVDPGRCGARGPLPRPFMAALRRGRPGGVLTRASLLLLLGAPAVLSGAGSITRRADADAGCRAGEAASCALAGRGAHCPSCPAAPPAGPVCRSG